jgi:outer membrane receptor protein involved in Fe transport
LGFSQPFDTNQDFKAMPAGFVGSWTILLVLIANYDVLRPAYGQQSAPPRSADVRVSDVEITATRIPELASMVPADISIISGEELRTRHATDLRSALALIPGVEAPSGGDTGPAGAVPSIWGLHEFDAFLLVVDGVPWGGAFNPAIPTLNLNNVERIEVLKGAAPVIYGATAFVGVIHVIHYPAGAAPGVATLGAGTHGSVRGALTINLPPIGDLDQSLSVDAERLGYAANREEIINGHAQYRARMALGPGELRSDIDLSVVHQVPTSPVVREGSMLTMLTPINANYNPADAKINENRYHAVVGYSLPIRFGTWDSTASIAYSDITDIRGFLRPDLIDDGSQNADSQNQHRHIFDIYADTHVTSHLADALDMVAGVDLLYGSARQRSVNGAYYVPLDGLTLAPASTSLHVDEINRIFDQRAFFGQYVQMDWNPLPILHITMGARMNETNETLKSAHLDGFDPTANLAATSSRSVVRPTGTLGASLSLLPKVPEAVVLYADLRNSFKPAAIDFGPDYTLNVLQPESAWIYEVGLKGRFAGGRVEYGLEIFQEDFRNLVVATTDASGNPILQNAGGQRLRGVEGELVFRPLHDLSLHLTGALHDARFTQYIATEGGANVNAAGKLLPLSPQFQCSAGFIYAPQNGLTVTAVINYIGRRYLDLANTAPTSAYVTLDASVGYRYGRYLLTLSGTNLSDQRPPVTASEFGDSSFYRLPGRTVFLDLRVDL